MMPRPAANRPSSASSPCSAARYLLRSLHCCHTNSHARTHRAGAPASWHPTACKGRDALRNRLQDRIRRYASRLSRRGAPLGLRLSWRQTATLHHASPLSKTVLAHPDTQPCASHSELHGSQPYVTTAGPNVLSIAASVRRTPGISCEAVPACCRGGAGIRRHLNESHADRPHAGAAESFVSFIPLFGGSITTPPTPLLPHQLSRPHPPGWRLCLLAPRRVQGA